MGPVTDRTRQDFGNTLRRSSQENLTILLINVLLPPTHHQHTTQVDIFLIYKILCLHASTVILLHSSSTSTQLPNSNTMKELLHISNITGG